MNISRINSAQPGWPVSQAGRGAPSESVPAGGGLKTPQDQLEISTAAKLMLELANLDPSASSSERAALINRIREEIAQGTYDTDEKMEIALMKFLQQHGAADD